ncbi:hypothetical protein AAFN86_13965 [Roseomonas sp. CAU 1739]|uniref:hypothetical protein n=1 Tax=Roseomonas sp. CAU 1739 TaxID=3140364 RepID=UPI00325B0566
MTIDLAARTTAGGDAAGDTYSAAFDSVIGGSGRDVLRGDADADNLIGGDGDDLIEGRINAVGINDNLSDWAGRGRTSSVWAPCRTARPGSGMWCWTSPSMRRTASTAWTCG